MIVGRGPELATVRRLVDGVRSGRGGVLLVTGEAGIGKSRLLAEAAGRARAAGLAVLTGRSVRGGGTYRPVAEALAGRPRGEPPPDLRPYRAALGRLVPEWYAGHLPESTVDPVLVLGEGLLRLLGQPPGGVPGQSSGAVLVLEDLHWADPETLALVGYLAGAARRWPVLVAASARDDEPGRPAVAALAGHPDVTTLPLRRLDPDEVAALASHHGRLSAADLRSVVDRSDGLPFLVEELVAGRVSAGPGIPPTFAELVGDRLAALPPDRRRVLEAAAVLGTDPDWVVLGPVTGQSEEAVLAALRAAVPHLLVPVGDGLCWRHALTRDAVLATVTGPERAALARRAARVLLRRHGSDDDARAADLLAAAGDRAGAAEVLLRLARTDLARGALRSAGDLLTRAAATDALRPAVAVERVRLLTLSGRAAEAMAVGAVAVDATTGAQHAELCLRLAEAAIAARRWDDAERYVDRAGRPDDPRALALSADAAFGPGDLVRAANLARSAAKLANLAGDEEALCRALTTLARCATRDDPVAAADTYRRVARIAAGRGLVPWRISALMGLAAVELNEHPTSTALREARELALDSGQLGQVVQADILAIDSIGNVDGPRAAEDLARAVAGEAARLRLPGQQAIATTYVAMSRTVAGDRAGAAAALDAATALPDPPIEVTAAAPVVRGLRHLLAHDLDRAAALVDEGMRILVGRDEAGPLPTWGLWALLSTVVGRRDGEVRDLVRRSPAALRAVNRGALEYADAVVAGRADRPGDAVDLLAAGDRTLAGQHWWRRLLRLLVLEAAVTDGWGEPVPALRADLAAFDRTGPADLARTCRDLLRRAGAPAPRGRRGGTPVPEPLRAAGVTSREMDVLGLLADGLTNREIAERLYVSRRTVDTHVASLLAKTGATSRAELRGHAGR